MRSRSFPALSSAVQAFFAAFALCVLGGISPADILSVVLFGAALLLFLAVRKAMGARTLPKHFSAVCRTLAALYTLFYAAGAYEKMMGGFDSALFRLGFLIGSAVGLYALFLACCRLGFFLLEKCALTCSARPFTRRQTLLCFFGLLLCWLFWFLYNYPGVMTPDSISQFLQATGQKPFSSHHPVAHTLLFSFFYHIGFWATGSVNAGIACYTVFQMLTLAAAETCCLSLLAKSGAKRWILTAGFLFWGLVPYNGIFAVTMWKDVLFSAFILLYVMTLFLLLKKTASGAPSPEISSKGLSLSGDRKLLLGCFFSGCAVCLMRSNGMYIFLFTLPFLLLAFRRHFKIMLPLQLAVLAVSVLLKGPVCNAFGVERPSFTESLSIPLQQVARVVSENRPLDPAEKELIDRVVTDAALIPDYYSPSISDPVKALVTYNNADAITEAPADYARLWAQLGLKYPADYVNAFIDQTKGYYFPAPANLRTNEGISPNEAGLSWPHLLPGQLPVKISEILLKLPDIVPLYGILWSIGAFFWAVLFLFGCQFLYGCKKYLILYLPFIGTILTLLIATPVASDLRYAYPLFLAMPFLLAVSVPSNSPIVFSSENG